MTKGNLLKGVLSLSLLFTVVLAQNNVDAIEKARQAKEAADKAAAEAAAATSAAIEAAAAKAAKEARSEAKRKKEEEEARKLAEAQAAEEAELDAAASAAAEEAKRKMAAELGLEIDNPDLEDAVGEQNATVAEAEVEEVVAKDGPGFSLGAAASVGLVSGATFTSVPVGGTFVLTTPIGFKIGPFDYTVSLAFGNYQGKYESDKDSDYTLPDNGAHFVDEFNPAFVGIGGNLTLAEFIFAEGHIGTVGAGSGFRGFAGITLERLMKKSLDLPLNILVGSEAFYSTDMAGAGNASGWASLGVRLDFAF